MNDDTLRRQNDDERLRRIEHALDGNGGPGIARRLLSVESLVLGGGGAPGISERLRRIERFMFEDPATGEKGLVNDVRALSAAVRSFQATLRTLNWILGLVGIGGAITFLRSLAG